MNLRRYLKAQPIVLRYGFMGPVLLIGYFFVIPPIARRNEPWVLYIGLFITFAAVVATPFVANSIGRREAELAALEQSGVLALAWIIGLTETGTRINDRPVIKVNLRIAGPGFAFDSQKRIEADIVRHGNLIRGKLVVLVDPATQNYEIDWGRSSLVNGMAPAQFTSVEDNRTYDLTGQAGPLMEILQIYKANNIPPSGVVDMRSNPALRQQVMAVVRRAAAQQTPPAAAPAAPTAAPPAPAAHPTVSQRLRKLETLRATGAISDVEYSAKREAIISEL
ncbi:hypothetical protein AWB92_25055 [Mycobacterium sp. IEC1808]|uniref:SHOCT domain-containing protein n=1 Tax=Mycobacterium sp. IEC1808 TaxID=1743230 RepID=UPI000A151DFE|nr:SHOCT domain-containing protein [Mycobacterium sp. IEC1808]ORW86641.1 hypothetical protein AWB92_25055 [Mycobacterium sp. IEC1808]